MASNTKKALCALMTLIDKKLKSDVIVILYGGTALTILETKRASDDIDLIVPASKEAYNEFESIYFKIASELKLTPGEHPPWKAFEASMLQINDCLQKAQLVKELTLKHITLYTMNPVDILLTKYHRSLPKDLKDIRDYLKKKGLTKQALQTRYFEILRQQTEIDVRRTFADKYEQFLKDFGSFLK
jgi:hypothetical protein